MSVLVPYVIEKSGREERAMDIYSRLLKDRIVILGSQINDVVANSIVAQLLFLQFEDSKADIHLYINSPGGSITAGLAIYDTMQYITCDVATYCVGQAASMGAILLTAGAPGKRNSLPNSRIMIHQPSGGVTGTSADIKLQAQEILILKQMCAQILAELTGKPIAKLIEDSERDFYMSPEEAVKYGLIDKIASQPKK
jgi:ATP-dependent Clp protease, protease subunit